MHEDKLGRGWHNQVRSLCGIKKVFLPDTIIEHKTILEYVTFIVFSELGKEILADLEESPLNQETYRQAFKHILASELCVQYGLNSKGMELRQKGVVLLRGLTQTSSTPNLGVDASKSSDRHSKVS